MITVRGVHDQHPLLEATPGDAVTIAKLLDVERESVWRIIHGMTYRDPSELALAVHHAFLGNPHTSGIPSPGPSPREAPTTVPSYARPDTGTSTGR